MVSMYNQLVDKHNALQNQLEWFIKQIHGTKSEKIHALNPSQMVLDGVLDGSATVETSLETEATDDKTKAKSDKSKPTGHGRREFPEHLPRVKKYIDINPELKEKYGEENLIKIDEVVSESLEIERRVYVKQVIRVKYIRKDQTGGERFLIPELPPRPIDKCVAGATLLVYVIVSKFIDHAPLYRLSKKLKRDGVDISENTMGGWLTQLHKLLLPVYLAMIDYLRKGDIINTDDTKLPVVVGDMRHKTHKGYVWVYISNGMVVYEYKKTRNRFGPFEFLEGFEGKYLQADACHSYDLAIETFTLIEVGCWAHARRKFLEAIDEEPVDAEYIVLLIKKLYVIEKHCKIKKFSPEETRAYRKEHSSKVLDKIKERMDALSSRTIPITPSSNMGKALTYARNQWTALNAYLKNGKLSIDNNVSERFMKYIVMGRKNYLFCGSHAAAERSALFYSLTSTCIFNDINPTEYLTDILKRLAKGESPQSLIPTEWASAKRPASESSTAEPLTGKREVPQI